MKIYENIWKKQSNIWKNGKIYDFFQISVRILYIYSILTHYLVPEQHRRFKIKLAIQIINWYKENDTGTVSLNTVELLHQS